jgi:hypothetical protein
MLIILSFSFLYPYVMTLFYMSCTLHAFTCGNNFLKIWVFEIYFEFLKFLKFLILSVFLVWVIYVIIIYIILSSCLFIYLTLIFCNSTTFDATIQV